MIENKKIVLGIDPGYDRVGWAIGETNSYQFSLKAFGCIQTNRKESIFKRYEQIQKKLSLVIKKFKPSQLAIETLFFSKNKKTALRVSEARGVIIATCLNSNLEIYEYSPVQIKLAVTGNGGANKLAVKKMVKLQIRTDIDRQLDDTIDAIAILMTHSFINHDMINK